MTKVISCILVLICLTVTTSAQTAAEKAAALVKEAADKATDAVKDAAAKEEKEPTFSVSGRIFFANNGVPLRRTYFDLIQLGYHTDDPKYLKNRPRINVSKYSLNSRGRYLTNDRGEFKVDHLERGWYVVVLPTPGVLNPRSFDFRYDIFPKILISEQNVDSVEIPVQMGASLSGHVRYPDGEPLVNAMVSLLTFKSVGEEEAEVLEAENVEHVRTDDRGFYRFAGLPPGNYVVLATRPVKHLKNSNNRWSEGFYLNETLATYYPSAHDVFDASKIELKLGFKKKDVDIVFINRDLYNVKAKVVDSVTKKPVYGLSFKFKRLDFQVREGEGRFGAETDESGTVSINDLLPGEYELSLSEKEYGSFRVGAKYAPKVHKFEVSSDSDNDLVVEVERGAVIKGELLTAGDLPKPRAATVLFFSKDQRVSARLRSGYYDAEKRKYIPSEKRTFQADRLLPGKYRISATVPNYALKDKSGKPIRYHLTKITHKGKVLANNEITVKKGELISDIKLYFSEQGARIRVQVEDMFRFNTAFGYLVPYTTTEPRLEDVYKGQVYGYGGFNDLVAPGKYYLFVTDVDLSTLKSEEEKLTWLKKMLPRARLIDMKPASDQSVKIRGIIDED